MLTLPPAGGSACVPAPSILGLVSKHIVAYGMPVMTLLEAFHVQTIWLSS